MTTATFCQEVESGVTQHQIDARVNEIITLGGALDAYAKTIGEKHYICAVQKVFDEPFDDILTNPVRADSDATIVTPVRAGGPAETAENKTKGSLTDENYRLAATTLGCETAAIRAVADVESGGKTGFLSDGRPKILFESHVFSKLTARRYDATHFDISTPTWKRNYDGGTAEYIRLGRAIKLDPEAALKAASWGKFQILGMNYVRAGFNTVSDFVAAQTQSEQEHLNAFVKFILSHDLSDELRDQRWTDFARKYNGARYAENRYDEKIASAL